MKVLINIPNELAEKEHWYTDEEIWTVIKAAQNGTSIPDNATNGDVIKAMFPNGTTAKFVTFMRFVVGEDEYINCAYDWWNAPYQKGGKE